MKRSTVNKPSDQKATYSIGAVSRLTGLTTHTLRMWEHRYSTVVAERQANGRRIYSPADVEKLSMLKALSDRGSPIGSIAGLSLEALRARLEQDHSLESGHEQATFNVAAMGATVPSLLRAESGRNERIHVAATSSEPSELNADVAGQPIDVLILEFSVLNAYSLALIEDLGKLHRASATIVVYRFGRNQDLAELDATGIVLLRNPVTGNELARAILASSGSEKQADHPQPESHLMTGRDTIYRSHEPPPARRYSTDRLARLAEIDSSVDCECPRHLAEILSGLGAFEVYSQNCEETDVQQVELHAYLHNATGRARAIMEEALAHLAEVERLPV